MKTLTQERLKELLHYDPETGVFTRKKNRGGRVKAGDVVKCRDYGYIVVTIDYKLYRIHRLTFLYMEGYIPEYQVDHINRIRDDNRWENLRHVTPSCNARNRTITKVSKSGITGVSWNKSTCKWDGRIGVTGEMKYLGSFKTLKEAGLDPLYDTEEAVRKAVEICRTGA